jgi:glycosyltransferase involved in cell wall biosynthesis
MKLVIGPFKDMSGYAELAREYIKALMSVDDESKYCLASVRYDSGSKTALEPELANAHKNIISSDVDTVIQIVTPNEMRPVPGKRNIAVCCWETDRIPFYWSITLNAFDEIIVPCEHNKTAFEKSGVSKPIHVIGMPVFSNQYSLDDVEPLVIPETSLDTTIYYNIAQWTHKKGIDAAIRSYFLAFQNDENVLLVLKGYVGMQKQAGDAQKVVGAINDIKSAMRLQKYPRIYVTDQVMSNEQLKQLHKLGDCYVNTTRGEGWGIPPFEAMLYGNDLITTHHTGMEEWANKEHCWVVDSMLDSVHNMPHSDKFLYTANENWYEPNVLSGANAFKAHYTNDKRNTNESRLLMYAKFDPKKLGQRFKEIIG